MPATAHPEVRGAVASARRVSRGSEETRPHGAAAHSTAGIHLDAPLLRVGEHDPLLDGRGAVGSTRLRGGLGLGGGLGHAGIISRGRDRFYKRPHEQC